jgi:peptide/nickel transport system substrate-binding protein
VRPGAGAPRQKGGAPLRLRLVFFDVQTNVDMGKTVQNQLGQLGVTVELHPLQGSTWVTDINRGNFDLAAFAWGSTPTPLSSSVGIYASPLGDNVRQNYGRIGSPEIDQLFAQGIGELDEAKRVEIGNRIDTLLWANMHDLPLYPRPEVAAVRSTLANFGATGFADVDYINAGYVK